MRGEREALTYENNVSFHNRGIGITSASLSGGGNFFAGGVPMKKIFVLFTIVSLSLLTSNCRRINSGDEDEQSSTIPGESAESVADAVNAAVSSLEITGGAGTTSQATNSSEDTEDTPTYTCTLTISGENPREYTLGSGKIDGVFGNSDYAFENWNLQEGKPLSLDAITRFDFSVRPDASDPCQTGLFRLWNFSGKVTRDFETGRVVKHMLRRLLTTFSGDEVEGHSFFAHVEVKLGDLQTNPDDPSLPSFRVLSDLYGVRERWIKNRLRMAQTLRGIGEGKMTTDSNESGSTFHDYSGNFCVHHLVAERFSFHEVDHARGYPGLANYCCHPRGGSDVVSVYPDSVSCFNGKPAESPELKVRVIFPESCGGDLTIEKLDLESGEVVDTDVEEAICNVVDL